MQLSLTAPDDFHLHLRDGDALARTVGDASRVFARALVMPNLRPAVDTTAAALAYRQRIEAARPEGQTFLPLMTLYLNAQTTPEEIERAAAQGIVAVKWYPKGATTNSEQGVVGLSGFSETLAAMSEKGLRLLIHGETPRAEVDIFARESHFIDEELRPLRRRFPRLKIVLEHASTQAAVDFVRAHDHIAATLTPQHLLFNRNALLVGGLKPHFYCLPILKTEADRRALVAAATSGDPRFFLGTDSAPHPRAHKENACGCAGCYSAYDALALYAQVFEEAGALHRLEDFASRFGADFYELPRNRGTVVLAKKSQQFPQSLPYGSAELVPFLGGECWPWQTLGKVD